MSIDPSLAGATFRLCPRCHNIYPASAQFCARDRSELVSDDRILAGKYILLRKIGEGNMGSVYEAEQPQIGRTVAVKVLRTDPEVMLRFEREVQAAGALNHPNVVTIFDSGFTDDGRGYIAMEYLEGESLGQHLEQKGPLSPVRAMELWVPVVRAMSAAHNKGIIHRDLKPDNVFLARQHSDEGSETVVKVLDFGIAKFKKGPPTGAKGTTPGMIIGTMQFMAPEQLQGAEADPRADVYALGLILVEMLTGRLPWGATKEQGYLQFALRMVVPPIPITQLRPEQEFSPKLQRLVEDMLISEPNNRPANAGELVQRLKQVPEALTVVRGEGTAERGSQSDISVLRPTQEAPERSGTMMVSRFALPKRLSPLLRRRAPLAGAALLLLTLLGGVYLVLRGSHVSTGTSAAADMGASRPRAPDVEQPKPSVPGPLVVGPQTPKTVIHRPGHGSPVLQVQFAFMDAKGVQLSCGGTRLGAPDCSHGAICKANAMVMAGQKCIIEKDKVKQIYSYSDLQKNAPDRKNLIHVLVRLP